jgi:hypothetical protein
LQSGGILPDDYDGRTFLPKQLRSFKSEAGSTAGNEDDFVRQFMIFSWSEGIDGIGFCSREHVSSPVHR